MSLKGFLGYPLCSLLLCVLYISDVLSFRFFFFKMHSFFREVLIPLFDMVCFIFCILVLEVCVSIHLEGIADEYL